jgi:hydroxymethylpyrimidine/phosphomethylpyrimidine kinase
VQNTRLSLSRGIRSKVPGSKKRLRPLVCSIGSTDPTASAGLALDVRVYERLGARSALVVAAVTAQNDRSVSAVAPLPSQVIHEQLRAVWQQSVPDAIRIGLLPDASGIAEVTRFLRELAARPPIVLDPVLASSSGTQFLGPGEMASLRRLMEIATVVTPNALEAQALSGIRVSDVAGARRAAAHLSELGCAVLVKGGHVPGARSVDILARDGRIVKTFAAPRLRASMRGTGCMLAAALAVRLALGDTLERAVQRARSFVRAELAKSRD